MKRSTLSSVLPSGTLLSLRSRGALRVACLIGRLWVTAEGDAEDILLEAGQSRLVAAGALVVIEALADAQAVVEGRFRLNRRPASESLPPDEKNPGAAPAFGLSGNCVCANVSHS